MNSSVYLAERTLTECLQKNIILMSSGLTALEIALKSHKIDKGELIVCDALYPYAALAIINAGGLPFFVDIQKDGFSFSLEGLKKAREKKIRLAIFTAYHGTIEDTKKGIEHWTMLGGDVIEDRAQAFSINDLPITHDCVFSFQDGKLLTCGQGGAFATSSLAREERARKLINLGWWPREFSDGSNGWDIGWKDRTIGASARISLASAILLIKNLNQIDDKIDKIDSKRQELITQLNLKTITKSYLQIPIRCCTTILILSKDTSRSKIVNDLKKSKIIAAKTIHPTINKWPMLDFLDNNIVLTNSEDLLNNSVFVVLND